jgi:hypothetical protein
MPRRCLYLVSSSASREYVADCLEALALPRGSVHHFRYLDRYVDERLRASLPDKPGGLPRNLREIPVVVTYLYQEQTGGAWKPANTESEEGSHLPLRCGRLIDAFIEGEIAHFYFELTDYIKPRHRQRSARSVLNERVRFRVAAGKGAAPSYAHLGQDLGMGAHRSNDALSFQKFVADAYKPSEWRTRSLGSAPLDVTYDVVFMRVAGLFLEREDRLVAVEPTARPLVGNPSAEYRLQVGATYHIQIATRLAARLPAEIPGQGSAKLRLAFDPALFRPAGTTGFRISSAYDLHYWSIVPIGSPNERSLLSIACDHTVAADDNFVRKELLCPELALPVCICDGVKRNSSGSRP